MDVHYHNATDDVTMIMTSDVNYKRAKLVLQIPRISNMLSEYRSAEPLSEERKEAFSLMENYIKMSMHPEFSYVGLLHSNETITVPKYELEQYVYTVSFVRPEKLTISVNKLDLSSQKELERRELLTSVIIKLQSTNKGELRSRMSEVFSMFVKDPDNSEMVSNEYITKTTGSVPSSSDSVLIKFPVDMHPYKKVEFQTDDIKNTAMKIAKSKLATSSDSDKKHARIMMLLVLMFIVILIICICIVRWVSKKTFMMNAK